MSQIMHSFVGYDRKTERVAQEFDVPDAALIRAKQLARVLDDDPEAIRCYSLDAAGARELAALLDTNIDLDRNEYFLEGFVYEFASDGMFRPDGLGWSVWMHNDGEKDHIKITVAPETLDEYASKHGQRDYRAVVDLLNARIGHRVEQVVNRAISDGRVINRASRESHTFGCVDLRFRDLDAILDE